MKGQRMRRSGLALVTQLKVGCVRGCGASLPSAQPLGSPANGKPGRKPLSTHAYSRHWNAWWFLWYKAFFRFSLPSSSPVRRTPCREERETRTDEISSALLIQCWATSLLFEVIIYRWAALSSGPESKEPWAQAQLCAVPWVLDPLLICGMGV